MNQLIRIRIDTLLAERGLKWSKIYRELGISKGRASLIRNGHKIPPLAVRISIAQALNCDTSVIWGEEFFKEARHE